MNSDNQKSLDPFNDIDAAGDAESQENILISRLKSEYYRKTLKWFFDQVFARIQPESVLEIGCGTGDLLNIVSKMAPGATLVGADRSSLLIERTKKRFPDYSFHVSDGRSLPFADNLFDLVFIATVLVHSEEPEKVVKEAARVTRPGGLIAVLDQDFETAVLYPGDRTITRRILNAATDFWKNGWIARSLPDLFYQAGLKEIESKAHVRIDREFDQNFFARLKDWVIESGLPENLVIAWYEELCKQASAPGKFFFSRNFYSVIGTKSSS